MEIRILPAADQVAQAAADFVAQEARESIAARGSFHFAVSGGTTPWQMLRALAKEDLPWAKIHLYQVDERIAPEGSSERNLTHILECLRDVLPVENLHAMPVSAADLTQACADYAQTLQAGAGTPPTLDLIHLGLGADGHTASLVPNDAVLDVMDTDVALTGEYQGRRRMTLTYPLLNRARRILWLATGAAKAEMLARLRAGDVTIPGGRVSGEHALVIADQPAVPSG